MYEENFKYFGDDLEKALSKNRVQSTFPHFIISFQNTKTIIYIHICIYVYTYIYVVYSYTSTVYENIKNCKRFCY